MPSEDRPIVVGGGPNHINVQLPDRTSSRPKTFSLTPTDPAVPFTTIVITDELGEIFRYPLQSDAWKITII